MARPTIASLIAGMAVMALGESIRIWGVGYAGKTTREGEVKAPLLVTGGPYSYVRNPLYIGNFFNGLGLCVMGCGAAAPGVAALFLALVILSNAIIYGVIIPHEEQFLRTAFGEPYDDFCRKVHRILPRLKPYEPRTGTFDWGVILKAEIHTLLLMAAVVGVMLWRMASVPR